MKFPLNVPLVTKLEKKYVNDVLKKNWLSIHGHHTLKFENDVCKYLGIKKAIALQSGTAALHAALKALGVKRGDKVIIPSYTCVSNISVLSQIGAVPIIVDVELDSFGMKVEGLELLIKKYKPKVLQLVHVYGFPSKNTIDICKLCLKYNIKLLEDFSESLGAEIKKKKVGTFGDISIFSIRSEKMIGVGEGGVVCTSNLEIFKKVSLISSRHSPFRKKNDPYWKKYYVSGEGYNYLLPHLLGAVARAQLENFKKTILPKKIKVGQLYRKIFNETSNYYFPQTKIKKNKPVYWLNALMIKKLNAKKIRKIGTELKKKGIEVRSGFWPLSELKCFKSIKPQKCINSKKLFNQMLILPSSLTLKKSQILFIKKTIDKSFKN